MKLKRSLYLAHRWLGVAMCLFFLMWFVSGIVMMYVAFPSLTSQERLAGLPNLDAQTVLVDPYPLINGVGAANVESLRLTTLVTRPAYLLKTKDGKFQSIFADTGEKTPAVTAEHALLQAQSFYRNTNAKTMSAAATAPSVRASIAQQNLIIDQWSVSSSLNPHRPLHKIALNDTAGTQLYVSTASGEVVRDTTQHERLWNWLGANLHWIYPFQLRQHVSVWHWLVVVLSFLGMLSVLTGGTVGLMRMRLRQRYRGRDITPYTGVKKIHHLLGLTCFLFFLTYITSGFLSMNPLGIFNSNASCQINERMYSGNLPENSTALRRDNIQQLVKNNSHLKEIRFHWVTDQVYPIGITESTETNFTQHLLEDHGQPLQAIAEHAVTTASAQCNKNTKIIKTTVLNAFDNYYYSHHGSDRPLPAYKIELSDDEKTWVYINASTGDWIFSKTFKQRIQRWLYNGLHSLDFLFLIERRPLWDLIVISLCLLGIVMAFSSAAIAFKRVRLKRSLN